MNEGFKDVSLPWYCALYFHYFYFCADAHTNSSPCELVQLHLFVCLFACILRLMNQLLPLLKSRNTNRKTHRNQAVEDYICVKSETIERTGHTGHRTGKAENRTQTPRSG